MNILSYTLNEPTAAVQFIGSALAFALVALLALAAKLAAVANERDEAQRAALAIQEDRDQYRERLAKERTVNNKIEAERERLAGEVADLNGMVGDLKAEVESLDLRGEMAYDALVLACESVSLPASERRRDPYTGKFMPNDPNYTASVIHDKIRKFYLGHAMVDIIKTANQLKDVSATAAE